MPLPLVIRPTPQRHRHAGKVVDVDELMLRHRFREIAAERNRCADTKLSSPTRCGRWISSLMPPPIGVDSSCLT